MDISTLTSWWTQRTPAQKQWAERGGWLVACLLCFTLGRCTAPPPIVEERLKIDEKAMEKTVWAATEKVKSEYESRLAETRAELDSWKTKATTKTVEVKEPVLLNCPKLPGQPESKPIVATKTTTMTNTTKEGEGTKSDTGRTDTVVTTTTDSQKGETKTEVKYVDRVVEREVKVGHVPDWHISLMVGGSFQAPILPIAGPLVLGLSGERRIIGPVWLGVWTIPQHGAVGGSLGVAF